MDKRVQRRRRAAFTTGFILFYGIVIVTLLWALGLF
jgi:hypothetical protein